MSPWKNKTEVTNCPTLSKSSMYHSSENMSETFTYPVEQQVKLL